MIQITDPTQNPHLVQSLVHAASLGLPAFYLAVGWRITLRYTDEDGDESIMTTMAPSPFVSQDDIPPKYRKYKFKTDAATVAPHREIVPCNFSRPPYVDSVGRLKLDMGDRHDLFPVAVVAADKQQPDLYYYLIEWTAGAHLHGERNPRVKLTDIDHLIDTFPQNIYPLSHGLSE